MFFKKFKKSAYKAFGRSFHDNHYLFVQKATPGSSEQVDSLHPALRLFCHFLTHTVKGSGPLHLVLHFKPGALSGQDYQLPALLMAAEAGAFPFWRSVWKDSTAFLADHLQADCVRHPYQESDAHPMPFPMKAGIALLTASKPRSSWTMPLCLLQPWAHPFSPGAHWAPLCVHTPPLQELSTACGQQKDCALILLIPPSQARGPFPLVRSSEA